jgi:hypothetical protein
MRGTGFYIDLFTYSSSDEFGQDGFIRGTDSLQGKSR